MLRLCGFQLSNYHKKVRIALLDKGIEFQEDPTCTPKQTDEYLARSPMGKAPFLELDSGRRLSESEVICEFLEDSYPQKPLLPKDPLERAKVRELITHMELHMELVTRRVYPAVFMGRSVSDEGKQAVEKDLPRGIRGFNALAKFGPYVAGSGPKPAACAA